MSLGRLLATGRSLAGGPSVGRYNVSSRNRLPKFRSTKNPFAQPASKPAAEQTSLPNVAPAETPASSPIANTANVPAAQLKHTQRLPQVIGATRVQRVAQRIVPVLKRLRALVITAASKLVLLAKRLWGRVKRVRRKEPRSLIPRFGKPAVQTELSLDNVKVVRNDLEESDLEIVTAQTDTSTQVAPTAAPAAPNRGPVPPALKKLTDRLLGVKLS